MKSLHFMYIVLACLIAGVCFLLPTVLVHDEESVPSVARLLFVGDMMFDRTIRIVAEKQGYDSLFSCLDSYLKGFDMVIGNLEGPITFASSTSVGTKPGDLGNTAFTFSPFIGQALFEHNIRMVNLGNNHITDKGREGVKSTQQVLDASGVAYFGAYGSSAATTTTIQGVEIGLVNFNQFLGENHPEKTIGIIRDLKSRGIFTVVYAHWGDEYVSENEFQKSLAHSFIDAGADAVIGSHPHVIQGYEIYKGKNIFYSLGNFIFDQYWDSLVSTGLGVEITLRDGVPTARQQIFTISRNGLTCPLVYNAGNGR